MSESSYYRIDPSGEAYYITTQRQKVIISDETFAKHANAATQGKSVKVPLLIHGSVLGDIVRGPVGMSVSPYSGTQMQYVFSVLLNYLPLNAPFIVDGADLVPAFREDDSKELKLKWTVLSDMRLILMIPVIYDGNRFIALEQFLFALTDRNLPYRLPTSNVYEDCRLCAGTFDSTGQTIMDTISKCVKQFELSRWQSDLSNRGGENGMRNSKRLFRFRPEDGDEFKQMPPLSAWPSLSTQVAVGFISSNLPFQV